MVTKVRKLGKCPVMVIANRESDCLGPDCEWWVPDEFTYEKGSSIDTGNCAIYEMGSASKPGMDD